MVSAAYATKLLADLGADVIKVEPPSGGDRARQRGPFPRGVSDPDCSGLFLYLNTNKRGLTLDISQARGHALLRRLAERADLFVHNLPPPLMDRYGVHYEELAAGNPRLVMVSITPFGLDGPYRDYAATDLVLWNAGGVAYLNGAPEADDLPPLKAFGHQAEYQGALTAAVASLGALFGRLRTGRGQHVVVSIQEAVAAILEMTFEYWPYMHVIASRLGRRPIQPLAFLELRDGWIFACCVEEHQWQGFVELMGNPEWARLELFENRLARGENGDALTLFLQEWAKEQSVMEVYRTAQQRRIPFAPVSTMGDLLNSEHLRARGFFAVLAHPEVDGGITVPGAPYQLSRTPWAIRRPAPRLGEHTEEILTRDLGLPPAEIDALREDHVL